ncbi:MAG: flagellar biosynthetic protein FliR [Planctomycetota bacterium]|nr:flagellar biosynthetic protein FliR [Planctomycetota bacterium]
MISNNDLVLFVLILTRVSAFFAFFPLFGRRQLPNLVKVGISGALTVFWLYECKAGLTAPINAVELTSLYGFLLILREAFIGFLMAFIMGFMFWPARVAGAYIGNEMGLSMAAINDPASQESSTLVSGILEAFTILLVFATDLHHFFLLVVHESFYGFNHIDFTNLPVEEIVQRLNQVPADGLLIIAPIMVLLGCLTVWVAYLNRAAPSLNLFTVGMPLRIAVGLCGLLWMAPAFIYASQRYLDRFQEDIEGILGVFV